MSIKPLVPCRFLQGGTAQRRRRLLLAFDGVRSGLGGRVALALLLGLLLAGAMSEGAFLLLKDGNDRAPGRIELVIPRGTAERVAAGEAVPSLPADMVFVVGDVLAVRNEDVVAHTLGPLWIPAGTTASLAIEAANRYSLACSFQPSRYLGLDVRSRVTFRTRLLAVLFAGPPMGVLIALYSLVLWPPQRGPRLHPPASP